MRRVPLILFGLLAPQGALACCGLIVTADGRPIGGAAATLVVARDGPHVVLSVVLAVPRTGAPMAVLMPLPGPMTLPQVGTLDPAALEPLLAETAPSIVPRADPDPCFAHPPAPPPPPQRADDALPAGTLGPADTTLFNADNRGLAAWLRARGLPNVPPGSMPASPILALGLRPSPDRAATAIAAVQLHYDAPQVTLPMLPAGSSIALLTLTRQGRMEPAELANRRVPAGIDVPEFLLDQFAHFYAAVVSRDTAALTEFTGVVRSDNLAALGAGWAAPAGVFVTRMLLPSGAQGRLRETTDVRPYRVEYRARIGWKGQYTLACSAGFDYRHAITARWQDENATLAELTGWRPDDIRRAMVAHWQRTRERAAD